MLLVQSDHLCCVFLQNSDTALYYAAYCGSNNVISMLLSNGADVNVVNEVSYISYDIMCGVY